MTPCCKLHPSTYMQPPHQCLVLCTTAGLYLGDSTEVNHAVWLNKPLLKILLPCIKKVSIGRIMRHWLPTSNNAHPQQVLTVCLCAGVGRGLIGAVGLPLSGALDLVTAVSSGLAASAGVSQYAQPRRSGRMSGMHEHISFLAGVVRHCVYATRQPALLACKYSPVLKAWDMQSHENCRQGYCCSCTFYSCMSKSLLRLLHVVRATGGQVTDSRVRPHRPWCMCDWSCVACGATATSVPWIFAAKLIE